MYQDYMMYGIVPENNYYKTVANSFRSDRKSRYLDEVIEIIVNSIKHEKEDELFYDMLINSTAQKEDKEIIMAIRDDEKKHSKLLRMLYKSITGTDYVENSSNENSNNFLVENSTYLEGLQKAFMEELKAFEKYRGALMKVTDREDYNKIFEIMTDEMKHAIKYNYLINKNLTKY